MTKADADPKETTMNAAEFKTASVVDYSNTGLQCELTVPLSVHTPRSVSFYSQMPAHVLETEVRKLVRLGWTVEVCGEWPGSYALREIAAGEG